MKFEDLRLIEPLLRAVRAEGYTQPTPIQAESIPLILDQRDVLGCAQTGTGKTAAFALPMIQLLGDRPARMKPGPGRIRALVLCPTRELAQQILDSFRTYGRHTKVRHTVVFGGVNQRSQVRAMKNGVDVLVATPGRLLDLMSQGLISVAGTEILVLDEADRMLDMGFMPDIRRILTQVPKKRQTLFFSATMPPPIRKLSGEILTDPVPIQVARVSSPAPSVSHWVHHVEKADKAALLLDMLTQTSYSRALVFTRTKHGADKVVRKLFQGDVRAAAIHGNKSQNARTRALAEFRSGRTPVLVATDIAARGLDVDDISHVINYDLTNEPETYIHRIGRTGRAGASGIALSFCTSDERQDLRAIERLLGSKLQLTSDSPEVRETRPQRSNRPAQKQNSRPQAHSGGPGRSSSRNARRRRSSRVAASS